MQKALSAFAALYCEQPLRVKRNHINVGHSDTSLTMATFKDPTQCFAPLEVIDRLLEIRAELGFPETLYIESADELTDFLDAYGFDIYSFSVGNEKINYGDYRSPVVPGGDSHHLSIMAH